MMWAILMMAALVAGNRVGLKEAAEKAFTGFHQAFDDGSVREIMKFYSPEAEMKCRDGYFRGTDEIATYWTEVLEKKGITKLEIIPNTGGEKMVDENTIVTWGTEFTVWDPRQNIKLKGKVIKAVWVRVDDGELLLQRQIFQGPHPTKEAWDSFVDKTFDSYPNDDPKNVVESFLFEKSGSTYATVGTKSGKNEYDLSPDGTRLVSKKYGYITATIDNGEFAWSHGYRSRLRTTGAPSFEGTEFSDLENYALREGQCAHEILQWDVDTPGTIRTLEDMTKEQCAELCDKVDECYSFETYRDYGSTGVHDGYPVAKPGMCQITRQYEAQCEAIDKFHLTCPGKTYNVDLYVKKGKSPLGRYVHKTTMCGGAGDIIRATKSFSFDDCAQKCDAYKGCTSFHYMAGEGAMNWIGECLLTNQTLKQWCHPDADCKRKETPNLYLLNGGEKRRKRQAEHASSSKCEKCLASGQDYCIGEDRCTRRATKSCHGPEDHVTGDTDFSKQAEHGHPFISMTCPGETKEVDSDDCEIDETLDPDMIRATEMWKRDQGKLKHMTEKQKIMWKLRKGGDRKFMSRKKRERRHKKKKHHHHRDRKHKMEDALGESFFV